MLDFSDNQWLETEKIKHLGICNNKEIRDSMRATITDEDIYEIILNDYKEKNLTAQELIDNE